MDLMTWLALRAGKVTRIMCADWLSASEMGHFSRLELVALLPQ